MFADCCNGFASRRLRGRVRSIVGLVLAAAAALANADAVIYDDALQNGFLDFSYVTPPGSIDFASTTHVHGGAKSIAFTPGGYDAVKFANDTTLFDTATTPRLHLWFFGTQAQCQGLDIILERKNGALDDTVGSGSLSGYASNCAALVAGQWFEITADLTQAPIAYAGTFDRISLFNGTGSALFGTVWFDDLALQSGVVDAIFANGFEGGNLPPPACGMTDEHDVTVLSMASDRFDWCDAAGLPRVAVLAHNDAGPGPGGTRGGELRQFSYRVAAATRTANASGSGASGFGYVVSHPLDDQSHCVAGDSSSLGHFFAGTWTRVFEGRHHAIFRFQQNYPRYCTTAAPAAEHDIPVTIDWVFASGRDDPLWSITYDMSAFADGTIYDDSRAPYGELLFDGSASEGAHSAIAGVGWGDQYKFTSTTNPVTLSSAWTWNQSNTIPYVKLWTTDIDATMGTVSTQTIAQKDVAGYFDVVDFWNHTSADNLANCNGAVGYTMPCIDFWPYQSINFSFGGNNVATNSTRLAWGTEYGFLGQSAYHIHGSTYWGGPLADVTRVGWPKQSYSLHVVLGTHAGDAVAARIGQVEALQTVTLSILGGTGGVAASGPAGVNRADTVSYAPAGYDPVYGALTFVASANALDANVAVGTGSLKNPLIIVRNYASASYPTVKFKGATLAVDVDYFPSLRAGSNELWITLNRSVSGASNELQIVP